MKKYLIKSSHNVYVDDYTEGELDWVNCYTLEACITAPNIQSAIQEYIENHLYYKFDYRGFYEDDESTNEGHYNVLVDEANEEANEYEIELWKAGKRKLYSNQIRLEFYKITPVNINK
jgi:hypothetical protein